MIRTVAMILISLAVMAAVQITIDSRLGPHCAEFELHQELRS